MQVSPIKPTLKAPGTKRLKLNNDKLLSNFAFKFNLRRYIEAALLMRERKPEKAEAGGLLRTGTRTANGARNTLYFV